MKTNLTFILMLILGCQLQAQVSFTLSSTLSVGTRPISVAAADVNGDGKVDLISANANSGTLTVLTNYGNGSLATANTYPVGDNPFSVAAADVNGDGKVDLICANGDANTLTVLTNNGSGGFTTAGTYAVGSGPASLTAADVNGDGKIDLISANSGANTLNVLTNKGSGSFATAKSYAVGSYPFCVEAADVNNDGKVDLISANADANTLTVLTNNGSGGFAIAGTYAVGNHPVSVTAADVNKDGYKDLICANQYANSLSVLTNNGSGGFATASQYVVGNNPVPVVAADINGDGQLDLICANYYDSTLSVLTNNGSGGFVQASSPFVGDGPRSLAAADVNGDGKLDLISANSDDVSANFDPNTLTVLTNFTPFPQTVPSCDPAPTGLVSWWRAEGNANDSVGGNNGFVTNGVVSYRAGKVGSTFHYNGGGGFIQVPASPSLNVGLSAGFTLEGWIQPGDIINQRPLMEWQFDGVQDGVHFWISSVGGAGCLYANVTDTANNSHPFSSPAGILTTNYQHVALTYDKTTGQASIYRNGILVANSNLGIFTPKTASNLLLGARTYLGGSLQFNYVGDLDETSVYGRALSQSEIAAIYTAGSAGKCVLVPVAPVITAQPTNQTVMVGNPASFSVTATGTAPLTYQWKFNGTNIIGATNAALTLANVQLTDAGIYLVLVANAVDSILSSNAVLAVVMPSCTSTASGLVSWWRAESNANDSIGGNNGNPTGGIAYTGGEVGQAFLFNGSTSYIPVPASPSLNIGTGGGITIEAWIKPAPNAAEAPVVEWDSASTDGAQLWVEANRKLFTNLKDTSGVGHVLYTVDGVVNTNAFQHVAVTYDKTSGMAVLYRNGVALTNANLGSFTPQTTYPMNIGRRTGQPIGLNKTFNGLMDDVSLYNRALPQSEIQSIYNAGSAGKCFVPVTPYITAQPTNQTVKVGDTASFSVTAGGTSPLAFQWNRNGTNILGATNATLSLLNVQLTQAGSYKVQISNIAGSTNSSVATLTVNPLLPVPVITAVSPAVGTNGTVITIAGTNFSPVVLNNTVHFGAVQAAVSAASVTNLTVTMPTGATFVPITETVNGLTAYAPQPFLPTFAGSGQINNSSLAARLDLPAGTGTVQVVIADVDGDGKPDLIVGDASIGKLSLYRNISTTGSLTAGSFAARVDLSLVASSGNSPYVIGAADLDGDGRLDLIALNADSNVISILRNISSPGNLTTNSFASRQDFPGGNAMRGLAMQDLNGDGKPEMVTANATSPGSISISRNMSTIGNIAFAARVDFVTGNGSSGTAIGDLDGDGRPDVAVANLFNSSISILRNTGADGGITSNSFAARVELPALASPRTIAIGDMDGDGKLDLVVGGNQGSQVVSVYRNTAIAGSITVGSFAARVDFAAPGWVNTLALGDLDGDGKLDIAAVSQSPSLLSVFKNVSLPGSFTTASLAARVDYPAGFNPQGIAVGDLDGDGRPDITFGNFYDSTISIYRNLAPFAAAPLITSQPTNQIVTLGDEVAFNVTASGTIPLVYQWKFNGTNIVGATNMTLAIPDVQLTDAGIYSVMVTNPYGSATSSNAQLVVNSPPVADASATTPLVISVNNSNATVVLNGSLSFDLDGDPLQYSWFHTGVLDPLATGVVAVVVLPVGTNSITLLVNDGLASDQQTISVEVITITEAVERLMDAVADVSHKQPLIASLKAALASIDRSNPTAAINQLQAFQNKVIAQVSPLDAALAQSLIDAAQSIINALSGGGLPSQKAIKATAHGNGKVHLNFAGAHQQMYIIEASTNLVDWEKIGVANDQGDGTFDFDDVDALRMPARFYRVVVP